MSNYIFGNKNFSGTQVIDREDGDEMNIYANVSNINSHEVCGGTEGAETTRNQPFQHTGSECVKNRSFRSVSVCLVVLCFLLLTAVIVLCVLIHTNNHQCHIISKNFTEERDQMLTNITEERDELKAKYNINTKLYERLNWEKNELMKYLHDKLTYYKSSLYFVSSEKKSWTESRRYCTDRGANLIIINNKEEQEFAKNYSGSTGFWIGLSYSNVEGTWRWVDGSTMTFRFWAEHNNVAGNKDCVVSETGWSVYPCNDTFKWICEKKTSFN